ncbi:glutamate racemase [Egicoccus sp. AB-alg6-2]|uniref:glutamate racemase n=1 Tax=Egicoccus sp. AB-alg6-2 TaxID=3242692 RepID=UPI00359E9460
MNDGPIGVFDSGLGGLTVLQALADLLPAEDLVYFGDTARYPYGDRRADELRRFSDQIADLLVDEGAKMLVVACNSATAAALTHLRERLAIPVIGVVEPGLRAAAKASRSRRTVVIGTRMTARSRIYEDTAERLKLDLQLEVLACPGFVELVEEGRTDTPEAVEVVHDRLAPLLTARTDTLVLGCTHYPLLSRAIGEVVGRHVTLVSSADETAFEVRDLLERMGWLRAADRPGRRVFITSGRADRFAELGRRFLGHRLHEVRAHAWETSEEAKRGAGQRAVGAS